MRRPTGSTYCCGVGRDERSYLHTPLHTMNHDLPRYYRSKIKGRATVTPSTVKRWVGQSGEAVNTSAPASVISTVSSDFAPGTLGFQAKACGT